VPYYGRSSKEFFYFHLKADCINLIVKYHEWPPNSTDFNHVTTNV